MEEKVCNVCGRTRPSNVIGSIGYAHPEKLASHFTPSERTERLQYCFDDPVCKEIADDWANNVVLL